MQSLSDKLPGICTSKDVHLLCAANQYHAIIDSVPVINDNGKHFPTRVWMLNIRAEEDGSLQKLAKIARVNSELLASIRPATGQRRLSTEQESEHSPTLRQDPISAENSNSGSFGEQHTSKKISSSSTHNSNQHADARLPSTADGQAQASAVTHSSNKQQSHLQQPKDVNDALLDVFDNVIDEVASRANGAKEKPLDQTGTDSSNVPQADCSASSHAMQDIAKPTASTGDAEEAANDQLLKVSDNGIDEASSSENGAKEKPLDPTVTDSSNIAQVDSSASSHATNGQNGRKGLLQPTGPTGKAEEAASSSIGAAEKPLNQTMTPPSLHNAQADDSTVLTGNVKEAESTGDFGVPSSVNGAHSNLMSNHSMQPPG